MKMYSAIFFFLILSELAAQSINQINSTEINIPYNSTKVSPDGKLDDWPESFTFIFEDTLTQFNETPFYRFEEVYPESVRKSEIKLPKSKNQVIFKAFWNLAELNIAIRVFDKHLFSQVEEYGEKPVVYMNDGIEIYLDTKDDSKQRMDINDYQFIVDIKNNSTVYRGDRLLIESKKYSVPKDFDQNILFKHAADYIGSMNDDAEADSLFTIELSIPFAAVGLEAKSGLKMKLDVCINDTDYPINKNCIKDYVSTCTFTYNWSGYSDFGYPDTWKKISLAGGPGIIESFVRKYSRSWLSIYLVTLLIAAGVVIFLFIRLKRLRTIPTRDEVEHASVIFMPMTSVHTEELPLNKKTLIAATNYIVNNRSKSIHSEDVAKELGISLRTFQRLTKEELNCTPTNYINIVKLNLAADYLSRNIGNVTDAAYEFGFSNPSYFSKLFKKHFGYPPSSHPDKSDKDR